MSLVALVRERLGDVTCERVQGELRYGCVEVRDSWEEGGRGGGRERERGREGRREGGEEKEGERVGRGAERGGRLRRKASYNLEQLAQSDTNIAVCMSADPPPDPPTAEIK